MEEKQHSQDRGTIVVDKPAEPRRYCVYVLNDDFTTFEFVISVMVNVFFKTEAEAEAIAESTHVSGKALVGVYSYDLAHSKVRKAETMARAENFPLRFKITPKAEGYNNAV